MEKKTMSFEEFREQEKYCRENNTPEGVGCVGCKGESSVCADNIRGIISKLYIDEPSPFILELPQMITVNKSNVHQVGYNSNDKEVFIKFNNGAIYKYLGVEKDEFEMMQTVPSIGSFLHRYFKGVKTYMRVK